MQTPSPLTGRRKVQIDSQKIDCRRHEIHHPSVVNEFKR
jgi:hypothetical protein